MKKKVLLVDDTQTALMALKMMLAGQGFEISTAQNGEEALKAVSETKPDLILLDIMMPKMNGIDCCRHIKNDDDTQEIPVIMVTTKGEAEMIDDSYAAGCNDYVTKPIDKLELIAKVQNYLK
jgi:putative two-component system response regulator